MRISTLEFLPGSVRHSPPSNELLRGHSEYLCQFARRSQADRPDFSLHIRDMLARNTAPFPVAKCQSPVCTTMITWPVFFEQVGHFYAFTLTAPVTSVRSETYLSGENCDTQDSVRCNGAILQSQYGRSRPSLARPWELPFPLEKTSSANHVPTHRKHNVSLEAPGTIGQTPTVRSIGCVFRRANSRGDVEPFETLGFANFLMVNVDTPETGIDTRR